MTTYEFVDNMGVPVWMSGFDALIDAIDILKSALQNNESPTIVDINRKLCLKYHTSTIAMDRAPSSGCRLCGGSEADTWAALLRGAGRYSSAGDAFEAVLVYLCAIFDAGGGVISYDADL